MLTPNPHRICQRCEKPFKAFLSFQRACIKCAKAEMKKVKALKKAETQARKIANKSIRQLADEAQAEVNRYVRLRDWNRGCVSCDKPATWQGQWHASHYRSVGAASAVRFCLWNIHKACSQCNRWLAGNIAAYKPRLIERIGAEREAWLWTQTQTVDWDKDHLVRMKRVFARKCRRMEKRLKAKETA